MKSQRIRTLLLVIILTLFWIYAESKVWYRYTGTKNYSIDNSVYNKITIPKGYDRIKTYKNSFAEWIRYLPVKPSNSGILTHEDIEPKSKSSILKFIKQTFQPYYFYNIWRVIDIPLYFSGNLEQCADWAYRFWYEYQKEVGFGDDLWLTNYNGKKITYQQWKEGRKGPTLKKFFKWTCNYANSYSQKVGLYKVGEKKNLIPGDLIVQNKTGGIGHVSIIFDICEDKKGNRLYLIGYSFMPAQECHIEKATDEHGIEGWFTLEGYFKYLEKYLDYGKPLLRSFIQKDSLKLYDNAIDNWQKYEKAVRDSKISVRKAVLLLPEIMDGLNEFTQKYKFNKLDNWAFPVEGYSIADIGGEQGSGFKPDIRYGTSPIRGYSFFDGNRHGGHPAHDIFIHDRNQDILDDRTGKTVFVVAMLDGIVISTFTKWQSGSKIRGGNYILCYHPQENLISYYAHLNDIIVEPGQKVLAGDRLGTIGRTGYSAEPKRSPTHLHLMVLEYKNRELLPYNFYKIIDHQ